jgi:hypothetical protein
MLGTTIYRGKRNHADQLHFTVNVLHQGTSRITSAYCKVAIHWICTQQGVCDTVKYVFFNFIASVLIDQLQGFRLKNKNGDLLLFQ